MTVKRSHLSIDTLRQAYGVLILSFYVPRKTCIDIQIAAPKREKDFF
jgi:hypothetical protein